MQNILITRRIPATLAAVLAAIGLLSTAGAVSAQSGLQYAIVTSGAGSVVAQLAGGGAIGAVVPVTLPGQTYTPSTGQTSALPVGTKVIPLFIVGTPAGMTLNTITGIKPPPSVHCPVNQLPTLILPASGPKSVMAAANWHCKSGGV